jgi:signal peptide peptidase SppA
MEIPHESIFLSAIRSFFKAFLGFLGLFFALIPIFFITAILLEDHGTQIKNILTILPDDKGNQDLLPSQAPVILRLDVHGVIGQDFLTASNFESLLLESQKGLLEKDRVKAILLHVNTPGGTVSDSDGIYRLLMSYKKKHQLPIYVYVDGMCASGGMYISSCADKIYSSPTSVIGSIGVILGPFFNIVQTLEKIGVEAQTLTEGKDKDMMSPFRKWEKGEDLCLKNLAAYFYQRFVSIVTLARPKLDKEKLISEYGAQVFDPLRAEELGYIDIGNADYTFALKELAKAANIDEKTPYQLVTLQPKSKWLSELIQGKSPLLTGQIKHVLQIGPKIYSENNEPFSYLYQPGS